MGGWCAATAVGALILGNALPSAAMATPAAIVGDMPVHATYRLWAQGGGEPCIYMARDVALDIDRLRQVLASPQVDHYGDLELLTSPRTPEICVKRLRKLARQVGFKGFHARPPTQFDRDAMIPPSG